jgi:hypothetical protein
MPDDFTRMTISELIEFAEQQAENEREMPSWVHQSGPQAGPLRCKSFAL